LYWYFALIISPVGHVIGKHRTKRLEFARRAIGVSAFYFAFLHAAVALWGQLGGISELSRLPELFKWSLLGGVIALIILALMAATSFDKVMKFMTFRKWKWLHRLVYTGGILAVLHIWSIGTHLSYTNIQLIAFAALIILAGLELFRTTKLLNEKYFHLAKSEAATLFITCWVVISLAIFMIPVAIQNYHSRHVESSHMSHGEEQK
jgi:sulfoxide reductase heme-binding subunit YedZ